MSGTVSSGTFTRVRGLPAWCPSTTGPGGRDRGPFIADRQRRSPMPIHRRSVVRAAAGLLLIVVAAECGAIGPELAVEIDNTGGPRAVTVTVDSSGPGMTAHDDVTVVPGEGAGWSVPLGSTWEIKVDGRHVIDSGDRTDLAPPSPGQGQDVTICIRFAGDGSLRTYDWCR